MKSVFGAAVVICMMMGTAAGSGTVLDPQLADELARMKNIDQAVLAASERAGMVDVVHRVHTKRMKEIVQQKGWPGIADVGVEGAQSAWLLVQHADFDKEWQKHALLAMQAKTGHDDVPREHIAYLTDRVAMNSHQKQVYGTQGRCVATNRWEPLPLAEPDNIDERRASMNLPALSGYIEMASRRMCRNFQR